MAIVRRYQAAGLLERRRAVPRFRWPRLLETEYGTAIAQIVDVQDELAPLLAELPRLLASSAAGRERRDEGEARHAVGLLDAARRALDRSMSPTQIERAARGMGKRVSDHQRGELSRQVQAAIGIDLVGNEAGINRVIDDFTTQNVTLIRSLGNKTLDDVAKIVSRAFVQGQRAEDVGAEIAKRFAISARHARVISRDQIGTLTGQVAATRHRAIGIERFRWSSMHDGRVRPRHRELDGQEFNYSAPPAEGLPGTPIMCRCYQEPVFGELQAAAAPLPAFLAAPRRVSLAPRPPRANAYRDRISADLKKRVRYDSAEKSVLVDQHLVGYVRADQSGSFSAMVTDRNGGAVRLGRLHTSEMEAQDELIAHVRLRMVDASGRIKKYNETTYRAAAARNDGAEMRAQVRGLLWDAGVLPRDAVLSAHADSLVVLPSSALPDALALHHWNGTVTIRREVLEQARGDSKDLYRHLRVMAHEELHGATPYGAFSFYRGAAAAVEEVTVEMSARRIAAEAVGIPVEWHVGSYQGAISKIFNIVQQEVGVGGTVTKIADAGVGMRSRKGRVMTIWTPDEMVRSFVSSLKVPAKSRAKIRSRIVAEVTSPR